MTTTVNTKYAGLLASILQARERLGCTLAVSVRGERCSVILSVRRPGHPETYTVHMTAPPAADPDRLAVMVGRLEPVHIERTLQVAMTMARNLEQHDAFAHALRGYRNFAGLPA